MCPIIYVVLFLPLWKDKTDYFWLPVIAAIGVSNVSESERRQQKERETDKKGGGEAQRWITQTKSVTPRCK